MPPTSPWIDARSLATLAGLDALKRRKKGGRWQMPEAVGGRRRGGPATGAGALGVARGLPARVARGRRPLWLRGGDVRRLRDVEAGGVQLQVWAFQLQRFGLGRARLGLASENRHPLTAGGVKLPDRSKQN